MNEEGGGSQFHCSAVLNVGKFINHNEERFYYEKGPNNLASVINKIKCCLSGETIGDGCETDDQKVLTATSRRSAFKAVSWQTVFNCNACLTGYLKKQRFCDHILNCVGGHVSSMIFEKISHLEHCILGYHKE